MLRRLLFFAARSRLAGWIVGWVFAHMSWILPVDRLHETENLVAFYHPAPSYPLHILIVPKIARPSLMQLSDADSSFFVDLFATVRLLVERFDLAAGGYQLIANGGSYQDVPQVHFHLVGDKAREEG
ncbi:MAG: HIT domain-containing protein [Anaerolineae bacterium]|nr:HIT domain-containing protein [Anaerolineae bacterium]